MSSASSMRANYAQGVERYYILAGSTYRNPHLLGLLKVVHKSLDVLWTSLCSGAGEVHVLDLAAGSGEASEALMAWYAKSYAKRGESTPLRIVASDPFTQSAFDTRQAAFRKQMTARGFLLDDLPISTSPAHSFSFADIAYRDALATLLADKQHFDLVIISFALHLVEEKGELWALLRVLSEKSRYLMIVAPHKKPEIKEDSWQRLDPLKPDSEPERRSVGGEAGDGLEIVIESTRLRLYRSTHSSHG